ncbi:DNA-binding response regulator [Curtobacterium sp. MCSS17_008]|uniref:response regulator n=1 Tax=Curtobacterium sp. MCSS17_008 TaxID=2175647 RepID=UPI000DA9276C|nr:response regulator transcription factor [Curtobacterium sp. MCSS17_008]PZF57770.1 DNA-binding response regulator [Curtobacterium sp. MCSS17_008]
MIRVLLVDDDDEVRESLRLVVEHEGDMVVAAEAACGERAVSVAAAVRVDVAVVDVQMPGIDGVETTRRLRALPRPPAVLVVTAFRPDDRPLGALEAGAAGFLLKAFRPQELPAAIREVAAGRQVLAPAVTATVVAEAMRARTRDPEPLPPDDLGDLTDRERQLCRAVGEGLTNAQIAAALGITATTAKTYVSRLLDKLGLQNRTQLAILAHRAGLL